MMKFGRFANRAEAGKALAARLLDQKLADPVVLALPRGGVPVAVEVARVLGATLDLVLVRKIGVPEQPELAAAAVVDGDTPELVVNAEVVALADITDDYIQKRMKAELVEIERRRQVYLEGRTPAVLSGRTLILVDDGIATGSSVRAAIAALRRKQPRKLVLAVPVAPRDTIEALRPNVDEIVCLDTPHPFHAIGLHYRDFRQVSDDEVVRLLRSVEAQHLPDSKDHPPRKRRRTNQ